MTDQVIKDYANWGAMMDDARSIPADHHQGDKDWCGTRNIGEAIKIADKGWPDGMSRVRNVALPAVNACKTALHEDGGWTYDVTGADYDVGEWLSGAPECWLTPHHVTQKPVITIMANTVSSAGIPKESLEMRGAAIAGLALALQTSGYAVRVFAVEGMHISGKDIWHRVNLTDDNGGPLDLDRVLFGLAHPSAARQIGYCLGSKMAGASTKSPNWISWPNGTGRGTGRDALPPEEWKADLYMKAPYLSDADWKNQESVESWVKATYDKITAGGDPMVLE